MENVLSLSIESQNYFNQNVFVQIFNDNKHYAEEANENVADYFIRDFDAQPEGWNACFDILMMKCHQKQKKREGIF